LAPSADVWTQFTLSGHSILMSVSYSEMLKPMVSSYVLL